MKYVGLDISIEQSSFCIVDEHGKVVTEGVVGTSPADIHLVLQSHMAEIVQVGFEATMLSTWLDAGLRDLGFQTVCMESFALSVLVAANRNKTDRIDARGIAQALRVGWFKSVYMKDLSSQHSRAMLTARQQLKKFDIAVTNNIRSYLRELGFRVAPAKGKMFKDDVLALSQLGRASGTVSSLVNVLDSVHREINNITLAIEMEAKADLVCVRLMTAPGVGPMTALAYRAAIVDPHRFSRSRDVGAHFGLTPSRYQSGQISYQGRISKCGDKSVRSALFMAAQSAIYRCKSDSQLVRWGRGLVKTRGSGIARIAGSTKNGRDFTFDVDKRN